MLFRSAQKAIEEIKAETGKEPILLELDLANLKSVKKSAEAFLRFVVASLLYVNHHG